MSQCQTCSAPAELFICRECVTTLRANLVKLARGPVVRDKPTQGLLADLADVVLKRTQIGNGSGHRKRGDEMPAPFEPDVEKLDKDGHLVLTMQGRADQLAIAARNTLSTIIRDLCETRAVTPSLDGDPVVMAAWLVRHVQVIACDESAGKTFDEIDALVRQIERVVDRPVKIELLGFCITQLDNNRSCDTALRAREDAIEVRCRKCRTTRRCDTVRAQGQSDARRALIPWSKVLETNKSQPEGWRVNERTLRNWRATGVLRPREYLRPDGSHGFVKRTNDDVELFKWNDVEQLRTKGATRVARKRVLAR